MKPSPAFVYRILFWIVAVNSLTTGFGQSTTMNSATKTAGGKGGKIIRVTNLSVSGEGSLQAAVDATGPRIIVFEISGQIDLNGQVLRIRQPFLTIAGQTAPSPGITLINGGIQVSTHDVILQHIRVRTGSQVKNELDAFTTVSAHDVLIDHCTFMWAVDENCSVSGPRFTGENPDEWRKNTSYRITISNNIIAEGLSNSIHSKGEHSKGSLIHDNATGILITGNLYASNVERNALFKGGARGVFVNNYIYNPRSKALHYAQVESEWTGQELQTGEITAVGNVLQLGPDSRNMAFAEVGKYGFCKLFLEDNLASDTKGNPLVLFKGDPIALVNEKPVWMEGLLPMKATGVRSSVLLNAGARPWDRDEHDQRVIEYVKQGKGKILDSELEVGGFGKVKSQRKAFNPREWDLSTLMRRNGKN